MHRLPLALLFAALTPPAAGAQEAPARPLVVMNLATHPDDEDGATLAYYRGNQDAVVYSVLFTRGEGGQNEIGPDLYEYLGAIRTAETEAAARILGTQVWYLNQYDFGFSRWADETFAEWSRPRPGFWDTSTPAAGAGAGRESVTARLVYLIRRLRPDVVFTNHDTVTVGAGAQHGHHQAVGLSAWDAFDRAADPSYHPEHLLEPGVEPWQPQRLFIRSRAAGAADVAVPVAAPCSDAEACSDRAVRAAVLHRSQGFDLLAPRFFRRDTTYFVLYRAASGAGALPAGATDLAAGLTLRDPATVVLSPDAAAASGRVPGLSGLETSTPVAVPGQRVDVRWAPVRSRVTFQLTDGAPFAAAPAGATGATIRIPDDASPTVPTVRAMYGRDRAGAPVQVVARQSGLLRSGPGAVTHAGGLPLEIAPPVVVTLPRAPIRLDARANEVRVAVQTWDPAARTVRVALRVERAGAPALHADTVTLAAGDTVAVFRFSLGDATPAGPARVIVEATATPTSAPAEPFVDSRPAALLPPIAVAPGLRVGIVRSYDRTTEDALRAMGADVVALDSLDLALGRFDGLHTIVLDIRAYLVRRDLRAHNERLLSWVRAGGHLVVGYQKTFEWNAGAPDPTQPEESGIVNPDFAPFPLELGRGRVVREDARVVLLTPDHAVFHAPHEIVAADWDGWVQERGLYFPGDYDPRYSELLEMNDPGFPPLRSALLVAPAGAGTFAYSPLVWYRQLEALSPGAWRIFANIVSMPLTAR